MGREDPVLIGSSTGPRTADHSKSNYDQRREQVRRAQKKHREQKEKRCRALEDELHRLYNLLTNADELRGLQHENEILKDIVTRYSIPLPSHIVSRGSAMAEVTMIGDSGSHQHLQVRLPSYDCQSSHATLCTPPYIDEGSDQDPQFPLEEATESPEIRPSYCPENRKFAQMGVDFVLSLERPCLFHTRPLGEGEPSGHAMSMQGLLLSEAPQYLPDRTSWEIPAQQLDKLFELSGSLGLEGFITPVQAWNRIVQQYTIAQMPSGQLSMLRSAMVPHIKCYGFGALMEEDIFERLLNDIFQ